MRVLSASSSAAGSSPRTSANTSGANGGGDETTQDGGFTSFLGIVQEVGTGSPASLEAQPTTSLPANRGTLRFFINLQWNNRREQWWLLSPDQVPPPCNDNYTAQEADPNFLIASTSENPTGDDTLSKRASWVAIKPLDFNAATNNKIWVRLPAA